MTQISPEQCRAARALLNWNIATLGQKSGVSPTTISYFERHKVLPRVSTTKKLFETFKHEGIELIENQELCAVSLNCNSVDLI